MKSSRALQKLKKMNWSQSSEELNWSQSSEERPYSSEIGFDLMKLTPTEEDLAKIIKEEKEYALREFKRKYMSVQEEVRKHFESLHRAMDKYLLYAERFEEMLDKKNDPIKRCLCVYYEEKEKEEMKKERKRGKRGRRRRRKKVTYVPKSLCLLMDCRRGMCAFCSRTCMECNKTFHDRCMDYEKCLRCKQYVCRRCNPNFRFMYCAVHGEMCLKCWKEAGCEERESCQKESNAFTTFMQLEKIK